MPKVAKQKSDLQVRAALRASQERRLAHACDVLRELTRIHHVSIRDMEHDMGTIGLMQGRLLAAIKNQHVKDRCIANARQAWIEQGGY